MNHRILGHGAIACSAVVMTQWIPTFGVYLPANVCQGETEPEPVSPPADSAQATPSQRCSLNGLISLIESLPEQFKLQWSQSSFPQLPRSMEREYRQLIEKAQTLASQNRVAEAITLVATIPKNTRHFDLAHQLQETWSQEILHQATSHYQQAELSTALKLLEAIPATSSQYPQVAQLKPKWQRDAAQLRGAIADSKAGNWQETIHWLEAFKNTPLFQSLPVQELWQIAMTRMLEPDSTLVEIASTIGSTSFSPASLSASPRYPISSSSSSPLPLPPLSSSLYADLGRALSPSANALLADKSRKTDRVVISPPSAPTKQDGTSAKIHQFGSSPSIAPAVGKLRAIVADR